MTDSIRPRRIPRYLAVGYLVAGAVFLFDPFVGVFDFLPDAIGYLLFARALYYFADMDDRLAEARRASLRMALLGVGRLFSLLLTFSFVSATERPVFMLLAVFTLGVLDLLVLLPMWRRLGGGFVYLGSRAGATALLKTHKGGSRSACERYVGFSILYFVLREALAVLPELTVLTHENGGAEWSGNSLYPYIGLIRTLAAAVSLALGVVWLVLTVRFVQKIKSDKPFVQALQDKYSAEVLPRHDLFAMRSVKASMISLSAAAILSADLYVEGVSMLPDPLSAVAMVLSLVFLRRYTEGKYRLPLAVTVCYGVASVVAWGMQIRYLGFNDLTNQNMLAERLSTVKTVQVVASVLFVAAFILILRLLYGLVRRYTGLRPLRDGSASTSERTESTHRYIRRKLFWVGFFSAVSAVSALVLWTVSPLMAPIEPLTRPDTGSALFIMLYDFVREAYWLIDLFLGVIFAILTIHASNEISEQMDYSYLMN